MLGVSVLALCSTVVTLPRSPVIPYAKTALHESMYAEGRRLFEVLHGMSRPGSDEPTGQYTASRVVSIRGWSNAPNVSKC